MIGIYAPRILIGRLSVAAALITPTTTAAPDMSALISSSPLAADRHNPPESKVIPLPVTKRSSSFQRRLVHFQDTHR